MLLRIVKQLRKISTPRHEKMAAGHWSPGRWPGGDKPNEATGTYCSNCSRGATR